MITDDKVGNTRLLRTLCSMGVKFMATKCEPTQDHHSRNGSRGNFYQQHQVCAWKLFIFGLAAMTKRTWEAGQSARGGKVSVGIMVRVNPYRIALWFGLPNAHGQSSIETIHFPVGLLGCVVAFCGQHEFVQ